MICIFEKASVAYYRVVRCGGDAVIYVLKVYVSGSIPDKLTEVAYLVPAGKSGRVIRLV